MLCAKARCSAYLYGTNVAYASDVIDLLQRHFPEEAVSGARADVERLLSMSTNEGYGQIFRSDCVVDRWGAAEPTETAT